ncbi:DUF4038 domain-containing protein [Deinococcus aestuarii]|uniref:apiosidase-like domain-containing protein n=1 Tax=Deinococcus aestuarii TaxID=2774531 RepID=UPI001C0D25E4|nr:DUF4038 domain-containing protein [Deinococcus aestuarii]
MLTPPRLPSPNLMTVAAVLTLGLLSTGCAEPEGRTASLAQAASPSAPARALRMMPLGDSITDGYNVPGGYRIELLGRLSARAPGVNLVGSLQNGPSSLADRDHEGHSGWRIDELAAQVDGWLDRAQPDVVLLMIGTNDIIQNRDLTRAPARLGALLDQISARRPSARVLVSSLPPLQNPDENRRVAAYNAALPALVASRAAQGKKISFVNVGATLTLADLADGVHPTAGGYGKLAARWDEALRRTPGALQVPKASGQLTLEPLPGGNTVGEQAASGRQAVGLWSSGQTVRFVVPGNLPAGSYTLRLTARADEYQGWPSVALRRGGTQLGTATVTSRTYAPFDLATTSLAPGQTLELEFTNDALGSKAGEDRNVIIDHLTLVPAQPRTAQGTPRAVVPTTSGSRLTVSPDGRRLQYADGRPFLYWADTGWELFHRLNRDDARLYLQTRASQGFTVIQAVALAEMDGLTVPNAQGDLPLVGKDPGRPLTTPGNDPGNAGAYDYWDHVDYVVNQAASLGLTVALLPSWGRWVNDEPIFTPASARSYGAFLGQRYKDKPVIWVLGGDRNPETEEQRAVWRALAEGIEQGVGGRDRALITYHPRGGKTSAEYFQADPWLDFNLWQTGHCRGEREAQKVLSTFKRTPIKPVVNAEPIYEQHAVCNDKNNGYADEVDVRNVAYWSTFAGAAGHSYGHRVIWGFDVYDGKKAWQEALSAPGARQLQIIKGLLESRPARERVPDETLVKGSFTGTRPVVALRGQDYAWVYLPDGGSVNVTLGRLEGGQVRAAWLDPRTGKTTEIGTYANSGERTFSAPSQGRANDWLLRIESP